MEHLEILRDIVGTHHERYDGAGYPKGLQGEDIPLEGRTTAVADVLEPSPVGDHIAVHGISMLASTT